jgi:hypothetical protein
VRSSEVDSSSRLALDSEYEGDSRLAVGGDRSGFGIGGAMQGYDATAFRGDPEDGGKSRSQRLKEIMADAESEMDSMLSRSRDARNAAGGLRFADYEGDYSSQPGQEAAGSGHASNAGDDLSLPGRNSALGQDDPEPKNDMERRINLRSKALQRQLPKYV